MLLLEFKSIFHVYTAVYIVSPIAIKFLLIFVTGTCFVANIIGVACRRYHCRRFQVPILFY